MRFFNDQKYQDLRKYLRKNQTEAEQILWEELRSKRCNNCKFYRQYGITRYIVDFYCPKQRLIIELDGSIHSQIRQKEYDAIRDNFFDQQNFTVLRFANDAVKNNINTILTTIKKHIV